MKHLHELRTVTCPDTGKVYPIPAGGSDDPPPADEPAPDDPPDDPKQDDPAPPWGSDDQFDPQKAWNLIQNLRGDIEELKPKAARLKELEDADKTEAQKAADRAEQAEERAEKAEAQAARLNAAVKYGLTEDDLELLDGVPADKVDERAEKLAQRLATGKKNGNHVPREGSTTPPQEDEMRQFTRQLFESAQP